MSIIWDYNEILYKPNHQFLGEDEIVYQIIDSNGDVSVATASLLVTCRINCKTFHLSWDASASPEVVSYRVYMGQSSLSLKPLADLGNVMNFEYPTASPGEYFFTVSAVNSFNIESSLSAPQSAVFVVD